ncbi:hypothetical protein [Synechococcus phage S-H38]|jgi:hypothetical protein|uniref:Uncharacterized protein n=1 Tax=Synechococcus phage S-H38 TaxID=2783673 RepID=A0A873WJV1_9CAUD|nr:hypothetical protein PQC14_gp140 [Synechococcus phage S-H38]QPB07921.1 hypothetical protein [Synechococcus phage S-H38]
MNDTDFYTMLSGNHDILNNMYDQVQEEEDWTDCILGDEEELVRQLNDAL